MKARLLVILAIPLLIIGVGFYIFVFSKPKVYNLEEFKTLTSKKEITLRLENFERAERLRVKILQEGKEVVLYDGVPLREIKIDVRPKGLGLKEGEAEAVVELQRFFFLRDTYRIKSLIDYTPPKVEVLFAPSRVMTGGSGTIKIAVSEDSKLSLRVGELEFPFYGAGNNTYLALFAVPLNFKGGIVIEAVDKVGNTTRLEVPSLVVLKEYPQYDIELKGKEEQMMPKLVSLLGDKANQLSFIEAFKKVNEDLRMQTEKTISEITKNSEKKIYWNEEFIQLKNSKVVSLFGERRIYTYEGKQISESYHWGYDLASVKNAPVEAANDGKVVYTGFLGIYGNTVIIDHGYGLMSIYAHLAEFKVKEGDFVKKGQIIGFTDTTGLAFGDHLHYEMRIHGVPVNPIEWWDKKWIKNNILPALQPSGVR